MNTTSDFYFTMVWILFFLLVIAVILVVVFMILYYLRNNTLRAEINKIKKTIHYINENFASHFKTTDDTITDLRKERDELKDEIRKYRKSSA